MMVVIKLLPPVNNTAYCNTIVKLGSRKVVKANCNTMIAKLRSIVFLRDYKYNGQGLRYLNSFRPNDAYIRR